MEFPIRINKYLRDKGFASRREADELIARGEVLVNGKPGQMGMMVREKDDVQLRRQEQKKCVYFAYHKPRGLATQGLKGEESVIEQWKEKGIFPIGRLDKESEGLLILTNDRRITAEVLDTRTEKEYLVHTAEKVRAGIPAILQKGMQTETFGKLLPAEAEIIDDRELRVVLREGKRHQIRVMLAELGYTVTGLKRVRIGGVKLGNLRPGENRPLRREEVGR